MKTWAILIVGAALLAGCGGSPSAVSANSADSVVTTATGNVVATIPTATPTPDDGNAAMMGEDTAATNAM